MTLPFDPFLATWAAYFFVFVLGLCLGSYLNAWVWRVHENQWQFLGRSMCVHCSKPLAWHDNIPLWSFLRLRGFSRCCHKPIPQQYFWGELATGLLLVAVTAYHVNLPMLNPVLYIRDVFFLTILLVVFLYDARYELVLVTVTVVAGVIGAIINAHYLGYGLDSLALAAAVGWVFFALQFYASHGK
jgi:leader peptidase (prepilin peptidase)/N-methyltransferase